MKTYLNSFTSFIEIATIEAKHVAINHKRIVEVRCTDDGYIVVFASAKNKEGTLISSHRGR